MLSVVLSEPSPSSTVGTVRLVLDASSPTTIGAAGTVTVSVAASGTTVSEGDAARFTLTLSESASAPVTVE